MRQAKRQRKPQQNQPDVVPLPPAEEIYQQPKPPRRVEYIENTNNSIHSKNEWDRRQAEAGNPTASDGPPVLDNHQQNCVGNFSNVKKNSSQSPTNSSCRKTPDNNSSKSISPESSAPSWSTTADPPWKIEFEKRSRRHQATKNSDQSRSSPGTIENQLGQSTWIKSQEIEPTSLRTQRNVIEKIPKENSVNDRIKNFERTKKSEPNVTQGSKNNLGKVEDSGYLSSTDSNGSQKQLLRHEVGSVSETDETESICDGASESGAESVGTDSVFFGNFRRLSDVSNFSKSVDSGVDVGMRNTFFKPFGIRNESVAMERSSVQASDSECESFNTVLAPGGDSRRNSLIL